MSNGNPPEPPFDPAALFQRLVDGGMDPTEAEATVQNHIRIAEFGQASGDEPEGPGKVASALAGFGQGVSFGLSDEIAGLLTAIPRLLPGGESPKDAFRRGVDEQRDQVAAAKEAHPLITGASQFVGGAAIPVGGAATGVVGKGAQLIGRRMLRGGLVGGGVGAATGAGTAEGGIGERLEAAIVPGLIGLGAGAVLGPVVGARAERAGTRSARLRRAEAGATKAEREAAEAVAPPASRSTGQAVDAATPDEQAVAKALGVPIDQVRGRVGEAATRAPGRVPQTPVTQDPVAQQIAAPRIGRPAVRGRPDLGVTVKAGRTQKAGPTTRSAARVEPEVDEDSVRDLLRAAGRTAAEARSEAPQRVRAIRQIASFLKRASTEEIEQQLVAAEQGSALFPEWAVKAAKQELGRRLAAA